MKNIIMILFIILLICFYVSIKEGFQTLVYPNNTELRYKKLNETCDSSSDYTNDNIALPTITSEDATLSNCLEACNNNTECQSMIFNNGDDKNCQFYNDKCYNFSSSTDYNPNRDCEEDRTCTYNKDNVITQRLRNQTTTNNRFLRTNDFCALDDENLGDIIQQNGEDETEVARVNQCISKCNTNANCNSIHIKNFGDTNTKKLKCRLYTGRCLKPGNFTTKNCDSELCSYNKYPCGQYECRERNLDDTSEFRLFCNNYLFDSTVYDSNSDCQARISEELEKPLEDRLVCPSNCNAEAKLFNQILVDIDDPNQFLLNNYNIGP